MTDEGWRKLMDKYCDRQCRMHCSYYGRIVVHGQETDRCPLLVAKAAQLAEETKDSAGNRATTPGPAFHKGHNMSDTDKAARKTPGKMTTWIGRWSGGATPCSEGGEPCGLPEPRIFTVLTAIEGATEKQVKEAIKGLGFGCYDTITGRCGETLNYREVVKTAFV